MLWSGRSLENGLEEHPLRACFCLIVREGSACSNPGVFLVPFHVDGPSLPHCCTHLTCLHLCSLQMPNCLLKIPILGNSLAVQWLGLSTFTAVARVQSVVRELRSHKLRGMATKNKTKQNKPKQFFHKNCPGDLSQQEVLPSSVASPVLAPTVSLSMLS